jgi:hypothetical protein
MKFAAGYVLGALTVFGFGSAYAAGILSHAKFMEKKAETASKITDTTVSDILKNYFEAKKN